jgi:hypothetical protein
VCIHQCCQVACETASNQPGIKSRCAEPQRTAEWAAASAGVWSPSRLPTCNCAHSTEEGEEKYERKIITKNKTMERERERERRDQEIRENGLKEENRKWGYGELERINEKW